MATHSLAVGRFAVCLLLVIFALRASCGLVEQDQEALEALRNATNLELLYTSWTNISCSTQFIRCEDDRVVSIVFREQGLEGILPPELGNLTFLEQLDIHGNRIRGEIPPELGQITGLKYLDLSDNLLTGKIPAELGNLKSLLDLNLSGNFLNGSIPSELGNLTSLTHLWIARNEMGGSLPPELGQLVNLEELLLQNNSLTGTIPPELGNLTALKTLQLGHNNLEGFIPTEIGWLSNLVTLTLNHNNISGEIPEDLGIMTCLAFVFLQNNSLGGVVPSFSEGNLTECNFGSPEQYDCQINNSTYICVPGLELCSDDTTDNSSDIFNDPVLTLTAFDLFIIACTFVGVLGAIGAFILVARRVKRPKPKKPRVSREIFMIENIVIQQKIGEGNFGEVFKGSWNGVACALKRISEEDNQIEAESALLSKLSHPNIVQFFGIFADKEARYMVLGYCSRGNLLSTLRKEETITLERKFSMMIEAASGMEYLQLNNILHRDLAARNLLVDDHYCVKVSDFGMSRHTHANYYRISSNFLPIRWSAPEVFKEHLFTSKSDVFSFGVVMWEIITSGGVPFVELSNADVVPHVLQGGKLPHVEECPAQLYELMMHCWELDATKRPDFTAVLKSLKEIKKELGLEAEVVVGTDAPSTTQFAYSQVDYKFSPL